MTLCWKPDSTPSILHSILRTIAEEYPVHEKTGGALEVRFEHTPGTTCTVKVAGHVATVRYGAPNQAMRAVGALLADLIPDPGTGIEHAPFGTFGFMLDCSRNSLVRP